MKNTKNVIVFAAVIAVIVFTAGCVTGPTVWDESHPENNTATIQFVNMKINGFNGINVSKFYYVKIPAGQAVFTGDVTVIHAGSQFLLKGMEFNFNFAAGENYKVSGSTSDMLWGVSIFQDNKFLVFRPFKEQP